jgi:hypothetical protein
MSPDTRPEYSPEQVRTAVSELRRYSSGFNFSWAITAVLFALAKAEGDSKRLDWLDGHAGLVAGDLTPQTQCRDAAFGWLKVPHPGDPRRALRDAIDVAMGKERE